MAEFLLTVGGMLTGVVVLYSIMALSAWWKDRDG